MPQPTSKTHFPDILYNELALIVATLRKFPERGFDPTKVATAIRSELAAMTAAVKKYKEEVYVVGKS